MAEGTFNYTQAARVVVQGKGDDGSILPVENIQGIVEQGSATIIPTADGFWLSPNGDQAQEVVVRAKADAQIGDGEYMLDTLILCHVVNPMAKNIDAVFAEIVPKDQIPQ